MDNYKVIKIRWIKISPNARLSNYRIVTIRVLKEVYS